MKDFITTFRSAFLGFNREDVIACVKSISSELDGLRGQLAESRELAGGLTAENERLTTLSSEMNAEAAKKISALSEELEELRAIFRRYNSAELDEMTEKLRVIEARYSEIGVELHRLLEENSAERQ
ncbi:MAG: hypothetical protein LBL25_05060 [Oscillospiraceae bacterium]|jgi:regulator of replication initiation timing|nr:hypothetical protein [Oscillospiraceae bacterium]